MLLCISLQGRCLALTQNLEFSGKPWTMIVTPGLPLFSLIKIILGSRVGSEMSKLPSSLFSLC